jgi:hypothetical protein
VKNVMVENFAKKGWQFSSVVSWLWDKKKSFVMGKATKPQWFKNSDIKELPTHCKSNKKASMTYIIQEWLKAFNAKMKEL